jgi:hypothetical protein
VVRRAMERIRTMNSVKAFAASKWFPESFAEMRPANLLQRTLCCS